MEREPSVGRTRVSIPVDLIAAYTATDFRFACSDTQIVVKIGQRLDAPAAFQRNGPIAVVTAYNPFSRETADRVNEARQRELIAAVEAEGLEWLPAVGVDPEDVWPPEPSLAVFGATDAHLDEWMERFEQNAVVVVSSSSPAELRLHPRAQLESGT